MRAGAWKGCCWYASVAADADDGVRGTKKAAGVIGVIGDLMSGDGWCC